MIRNYLKNFEKYSILISSLLIILGIFLLVSPMKSLEVAVIFFAAIMIVNGISTGHYFYKKRLRKNIKILEEIGT